MKSIIQSEKRCLICKSEGTFYEPLDEHHVFGGALRPISEKYGLTVYLCHNKCHIFGERAVHVNHSTDVQIKRYAQKKAMKVYGWTTEEFREHFRKNYLEEV